MKKTPKVITNREEDDMTQRAEGYLTELEAVYPHAREIDLLNAFLRAFNFRNGG